MAGVLGGCVWARFVVLSLFCRLFVVFVVGLWCRPTFGTCLVSCAFRLPPAVSGSGVRCGRACWAGVSAVPRPSWLGCRGVFFALVCFFFRLLGVPVLGLVVSPHMPFLSGWAAGVFFFFMVCVCLFQCPFSRWAAVPSLVLPVLAGWSPCASLGVLSSVPPVRGVWLPFVLLAGGLVAVGCFSFFFAGGGRPGCSPLCLPSAGARSVAGVWCGWSLATPGGGSCVLLPATPGWVSLPVLVGGPRHSWLGSAGGGGVWCVVCGGGVLCGWSLATPGGGSCVLLPATPNWVSLPVVVGGPRHSWLGSAGGGGVWCVVCGGGVLVGLWLVCGVAGPSPLLPEVPVCYSPPLLAGFRCRCWWAVPATPGWGPLAAVVCGVWCVAAVCGVVGPSPLLAEVPVCYSPPLLAGFRCRWWWAVPATPGWGPLAALVCGVWCVAVVCWWGCGWCVVWLVPRHSWRRFLCATPRHSWLSFAAGVGGRSPPLLAGVRWRRWCVVCGVWRWCVGGVVAGVWCGWSLATPGGGSCVLLPATPGWVSLPVVVGGPRHSRLGSAGGGGVWCSDVWRWCVDGVVAGVWCGWSLATPGGGRRVLLPASPGWVSLPVVVGGPRHSWLGFAGGGGVWLVVCGGGVLVGLWLVCGVVGPSPRLAVVPVCLSPPLLAGFRWRRWCVVCGVWCVAMVCWWGCGWCVVWLVPRHSWRRLLFDTPRHSWLGFAAGGGGRSPPLLAGVRWRRWCVVCGVWRWCVGGVVAGVWSGWSLATPGGGRCVLLPATPGWVSLPVVVGGPRHSSLGFAGGGGVWCVLCGVWCVAVVCWWGCGWCVVWLVPRHA